MPETRGSLVTQVGVSYKPSARRRRGVFHTWWFLSVDVCKQLRVAELMGRCNQVGSALTGSKNALLLMGGGPDDASRAATCCKQDWQGPCVERAATGQKRSGWAARRRTRLHTRKQSRGSQQAATTETGKANTAVGGGGIAGGTAAWQSAGVRAQACTHAAATQRTHRGTPHEFRGNGRC